MPIILEKTSSVKPHEVNLFHTDVKLFQEPSCHITSAMKIID